ncbi:MULTISPECIES: iron-containing alcohol dehydrogenase [Mycolicibacterium]|jgi:alcohol dehydrogenase class IV|uniref:Iron-containing alcohol dehydrogenase n=1 Tax=Mycolicibacterium vanbaalenii (strain DSM 7251 / JCM 13017 / BCRC 16820 / KCTC 9966 / NRRL B-24157 / PYR-1) TaxID=350058 RepID=A1TGE5_MYCVP|nr:MULTISPECIES: iron-containing alcohol dehydrogenase [Mycolicibacterium]ABM16245.1 iron-containing alcohol dehydrogenase [Mycolicibacterium vanbaalenii PYR-1]MCV7126515.1 iron-containing alcohol dehydrogenase [Mycolicibacterium vanbaalenii PYR-1]MDW5614941.1 iron-containing alcohol dehydrogenase [Mycolicibacterium sp. D5.8-2]PQP43675.1 alcohol dehydrogenase [Mycolicibacterium austroafricanum]QRZ06549.1 iron-containing alcohol dehydrogenase [Mycolicibacterium austroafricanum]
MGARYPTLTPELDRGRAATTPRLLKFHAPEIVFGIDSMVEAAHAAVRLGAQRPMLVTDPGLIEAGWSDEMVTHLAGMGVRAAIWSDLTPNPKDHEVAAGYQKYAEHGCDVIVAVGGGSVIDAAKGVAILAANGGDILDYEGVDKAQVPIPPMVVVPSTSGTGADVSQFCIVTDTTRNTKITILGRALVPDITVIDPRLLTTMPEWLNAATGLDALTHGIEAFVSLGHNQLTDHHALRAVQMVTDNLVHTIDRPNEMPARVLMAQAALEAGLAFTNAILGAAHAMSHQVGGLLDLPHGVINGVLLPHVIRFNAEADPEPYQVIATSLGVTDPGAPAAEAALALADRIDRLARDVGVPRGLAELGVAEDDLPRLARTALQDACMSTNPRPADEAQMHALFRAAL